MDVDPQPEQNQPDDEHHVAAAEEGGAEGEQDSHAREQPPDLGDLRLNERQGLVACTGAIARVVEICESHA